MPIANITHQINVSGELDYVNKHNLTIAKVVEIVNEINNAMGADANLKAAIDAIIKNLPNPVVDGDAVSQGWLVSYVAAQILLGGAPADVAVTALGVGNMTDLQLLRRNGAALEGVPLSALAITALDKGQAASGQTLVINKTGNIAGRKKIYSLFEF